MAREELPFGGVGPSGTGSYHGYDGFKEFRHGNAIYSQLKKGNPRLVVLRPPYGASMRKYMYGAIGRKGQGPTAAGDVETPVALSLDRPFVDDERQATR